jgi:hypothetical protein
MSPGVVVKKWSSYLYSQYQEKNFVAEYIGLQNWCTFSKQNFEKNLEWLSAA